MAPGRPGATPETSGRRLRIAAHNGAPLWGGAEIATSRLLAGLQERGHEVLFFYNREVVAQGARGHGLEVAGAHLGGDIAIHHALRFALRLRRVRPDVLVVGTFRKLWLAALAASLAGVPVVARIGLSTDLPRNGKYRLVFRRLVDCVITSAHDVADDYRRRLPGAPPPAIVTIHKGIGAQEVRARRGEVRRSLGVEPGATLVGGVGRLVSQKRFDRLIEAFALLDPGPQLVLVGDGPLREPLESLCDELGVRERVRFAGHRHDIADVMSALDLLVISSDRESMANVMLEAMAVAVPVVSTPVSGAREALEAEPGEEDDAVPASAEAGRVVEATPEALAAAMAGLLSDRSVLEVMGRAARHLAATRFGEDRMLDEWERALATLVEEKRTG